VRRDPAAPVRARAALPPPPRKPPPPCFQSAGRRVGSHPFASRRLAVRRPAVRLLAVRRPAVRRAGVPRPAVRRLASRFGLPFAHSGAAFPNAVETRSLVLEFRHYGRLVRHRPCPSRVLRHFRSSSRRPRPLLTGRCRRCVPGSGSGCGCGCGCGCGSRLRFPFPDPRRSPLSARRRHFPRFRRFAHLRQVRRFRHDPASQPCRSRRPWKSQPTSPRGGIPPHEQFRCPSSAPSRPDSLDVRAVQILSPSPAAAIARR
jgi:hypothetical protein